MTFYKCNSCDEVYEKVWDGGSCSGPDCSVVELAPKTADYKNEKHVPMVEKTENGIIVKVGSTAHPMTEDHYITMIQVVAGDFVMRKNLKPGDKPEAEFPINDVNVKAYEFCNKHSLWSN